MSRQIGLLPGTFDPIHLGHVSLAQSALSEGGLDEVWLLVDAHPAFKVNVLPYSQRFEMTSLATRDTPGVSVEAVPARIRQLPHTMDGFSQLMHELPHEQFVFIIGLDTLGRLSTWKHYEQVVEKASFLVARRAGVNIESVETLRSRMGVLGERLKVKEFLLKEFPEVSSSVIRAQLKAGECPLGLDPRVYHYILAHQLYR